MNILLTNDDGVHAEGLWALYRQFCIHHAVTVVAPDRERSAVGHGISLYQPLRIKCITVNGGYRAYSVDGTPADCVKLGISEIMETRPDVVVSGMNPGANVGINLNYSGTVCAAREASFYGINALAVSIDGRSPGYYADCAGFVEKLSCTVHKQGLPRGTFLNVNIPDMPMNRLKGIRISRQAEDVPVNGFEKRVDPRRKTYYWQEADQRLVPKDTDWDSTVLVERNISITPLRSDMTDNRLIDDLQAWRISI